MTIPLERLHALFLMVRSRGDHELLLKLDRLMDLPDSAQREQQFVEITKQLKSRD